MHFNIHDDTKDLFTPLAGFIRTYVSPLDGTEHLGVIQYLSTYLLFRYIYRKNIRFRCPTMNRKQYFLCFVHFVENARMNVGRLRRETFTSVRIIARDWL